MQKSVYWVDEVAGILNMSRSCAYEAVRTGQIPSVRLGRRILIPRGALNRLLGEDAQTESTQGSQRNEGKYTQHRRAKLMITWVFGDDSISEKEQRDGEMILAKSIARQIVLDHPEFLGSCLSESLKGSSSP